MHHIFLKRTQVAKDSIGLLVENKLQYSQYSVQYLQRINKQTYNSSFLMISLKDEIKKFQNLVYNKQLAQFVTVDQIFMGGGITIESMIHQSHFIVEQLKKMRETFINYCKLNDKVYTRIMQHEINLHNQFDRISNIGGTLDRKIEETTKIMQSLHQSTIRQNVKSMKMLQSALQPIRKNIETKVDKQTFQAQIRKIIIQNQDQDYVREDEIIREEIRYINQVKKEESIKNIGGAILSLGLNVVEQAKIATIQRVVPNKSKSKVGAEELAKLQLQIDSKFKALHQQLKQLSNADIQLREFIQRQIPPIHKNTSDLSMQKIEIFRVNKQIEEQEKQFKIQIEKVYQELNKKTNDQLWKTKLQQFHQRYTMPHMTRFDQALKKMQKSAQDYKEANNQRISCIQSQFPKINAQINSIQANLEKHSKDIHNTNNKIDINYEQFCRQRSNIWRSIDNFKMQSGVRFKQMQKSLKIQVQQLQVTIQNLSKRIEQAVLKIVNKRISAQLRVIQMDIKQNRDKTRQNSHDVVVVCDQINNIKDILSRKANFADIILLFQKKTDLEDFKQLQYRFHQTSQHLAPKKSTETVVNNSIQKTQKRKAPSIVRVSKTMLAGRSTTNRLNKTDLDISTKLFMCGIDLGNQFSQNQVHFRQNPKKKIIKSSTAAVNE